MASSIKEALNSNNRKKGSITIPRPILYTLPRCQNQNILDLGIKYDYKEHHKGHAWVYELDSHGKEVIKFLTENKYRIWLYSSMECRMYLSFWIGYQPETKRFVVRGNQGTLGELLPEETLKRLQMRVLMDKYKISLESRYTDLIHILDKPGMTSFLETIWKDNRYAIAVEDSFEI